MQPKQFRPRPNSFNEIKKKVLLRTVPIMILSMGTGIVIAHVNSTHSGEDDSNVLPFVIPILALYIFYKIYNTLGKQKVFFESYTLTVDETSITREQKGMPAITLSKWEIKTINKLENGSFVIKGQSRLDLICVPAQLEDYATAEALLNSFSPVTPKPVPLVQQYAIPILILGIGLLAAVFLLKDKILVSISGTIAAGLLVWSLYIGLRSKNIDQKSKRGALWAGVVILAIIFRIVTVWTNSNLLN
ncbi:hypothetical protein [Flavisolibacter tropicus]|uniref:Uncharacterized protein n=1 Tax=Flavisolibacter tropicus TaxID=1492898 RepID=A0A172TWF2_9BACT|nr:hypothetical protein [Flavisolibacter tropicus]ANE51419.1 hypothetical protein SY85_13800 [Flavisolibacter tropicus]